MNTKSLLNKLGKKFPKKYAKMNHDFVGLMTGKLPEEIHKIVLCLDCDWEIFDRIKEEKPDLVLTHHPLVYGLRSRVFKRDPSKKELCDALDAINVPVYSMHTNFDTGLGGMNDALAEALHLKNVKVIEENIMMRGGELESPMSAEEFAKMANKAFNVHYSLLINKGKKENRSIAIIGGGGSGNWPIAKDNGYDIYVSGDAPHHVRRDIVNAKYNYLDMPHEIEKIFMPTMKKLIHELDESIEIVVIDHEVEPIVIK
ncbi:MAG: Nif3-like dinuclear metal center hexameric protein [Bacilli bacterium]|nr:Nif3-like dinuclear metal center hexameric protein [Bacilli bacterium]